MLRLQPCPASQPLTKEATNRHTLYAGWSFIGSISVSSVCLLCCGKWQQGSKLLHATTRL